MVDKSDIERLSFLIDKFFINNFRGIDNIERIFGVDKKVLYEVLNKVDQRREYFRIFHNIKISEFKQISLIVFWIIKLKPIFLKSNDGFSVIDDHKSDLINDYVSINEAFGIYVIISCLRALVSNSNNNSSDEKITSFFTEDYIYELRYTFYYRDVSKEALIILVETIAKAVGYQPYSCSNDN